MTRALLLIVAGAAVVSLASFGAVHALGGLDATFDGDANAAPARGPVVTRDLPWSGGDSFSVSVPARITYTQGPQVKVTVSGPRPAVEALRFKDGELSTPGARHFHLRNADRVTVTVTSPGTHIFNLSGAQDLILANYDQDSLELHLSGAGAVKAQGRTRRAVVEISGAGSLDLRNLPMDEAKVDFSGAGAATLDPRRSADISISGAGHVRLLTRPAHLHTDISGIGAVSAPDGAGKAVIGDSHDKTKSEGGDD